jgi:hypothetical protein
MATHEPDPIIQQGQRSDWCRKLIRRPISSSTTTKKTIKQLK